MESKDLDRLFKDGLEQEFEFEGRTRQWQEIAPELHPLKRRLRFAWWWLGLTLVVGTLGWQLFSQRTLSDYLVETAAPNAIRIEQEKIQTETIRESQHKNTSVTAKPYNTTQETRLQSELLSSTSGETLPNWQWTVAAPPSEAYPANSNSDIAIEQMPSTTHPLNESEKDKVYDYRDENKSEDILLPHELIEEQTLLQPLASRPAFIQALPRALPLVINMPEAVLPKVRKSTGLTLLLGRQQSKTFDSAVEEDIANVAYVGLAFRLARNWQAVVRYSQGNYQRTTTQAPSTYNIPLEEVPVEFTSPNQTDLQYRRSMLDVGVRYQLPLGQFARLNLQTGVQLAQHRNMQATYFYQNIYQTQEVEVELPNQSWHLASLFGGLGLEVPVLPRLAVTGSYHYYRDISKRQLRWPNNGQLLLGLQYQF